MGGTMFLRLASLMIAAIFLSNCNTKSTDNSTPANEAAKYYTESESQHEANKVSQELGITIDITNEKDFNNEYKVNRILQILKRNRAIISKNVGDIEKIYISNDYGSGIKTNFAISNKAIVVISVHTTESEIIKYFNNDLAQSKKESILLAELNLATDLKIIDHVGITPESMPKIKEKLVMLSKDVNFKQSTGFTTLEIGNAYLMTPDGLVIDINSDYATLLSNVKESIEMRLRLERDVAPVLLKAGLNLSIQSGVFTPFEISQVLKFMASQAVIISTHGGEFNNFLVGKRWDFNLKSKIILIDYKATSDQIREKLAQLSTNNPDIDFLNVQESIKKSLAQSGLPLEAVILDLPKTAQALQDLKNSIGFLNSPTVITYAKQMGVKIINLNTVETRFVYGTKVFFIKVPLDATFELKVKQEILNNNLLLIKSEIKSLANSKKVNLELEEVVASESYFEDLKSLKIFLSDVLDEKLISDSKLATIRTTRQVNTTTQFANGILIISFNDFDPIKTKNLLKPQ